jgi:hypothetical protein
MSCIEIGRDMARKLVDSAGNPSREVHLTEPELAGLLANAAALGFEAGAKMALDALKGIYNSARVPQ